MRHAARQFNRNGSNWLELVHHHSRPAWQIECDYRATTDDTLDVHLAAMAIDEMLDHRKPQARTATCRLGRVEGLKGAVYLVGCHTAACVSNAHANIRADFWRCGVNDDIGV